MRLEALGEQPLVGPWEGTKKGLEYGDVTLHR